MKDIKFKAEAYCGKAYNSNPYMYRYGVQIVAYDATTGKRKAIFKTRIGRTPCYKIAEFACHYKSGLNKVDRRHFAERMNEAELMAAGWNRVPEHCPICRSAWDEFGECPQGHTPDEL